MHKSLQIFAIAGLLLNAAAYAQSTGNVRYRWHDGTGLSHFSDSLTADAMKNGYDIVNDRGMVVHHVPRQLNAEERAAANKAAAAEAAKQRAAQQIADAENQMMEAYPDEDSYRISQQQTLDTIDQKIHTTQITLRSQEKALTDLLGRAADIEQGKNPVPKFLTDSIATQRDVVASQRSLLQRQQQEHEDAVAMQAKQLSRYRELKAAQGKDSQ